MKEFESAAVHIFGFAVAVALKNGDQQSVSELASLGTQFLLRFRGYLEVRTDYGPAAL